MRAQHTNTYTYTHTHTHTHTHTQTGLTRFKRGVILKLVSKSDFKHISEDPAWGGICEVLQGGWQGLVGLHLEGFFLTDDECLVLARSLTTSGGNLKELTMIQMFQYGYLSGTIELARSLALLPKLERVTWPGLRCQQPDHSRALYAALKTHKGLRTIEIHGAHVLPDLIHVMKNNPRLTSVSLVGMIVDHVRVRDVVQAMPDCVRHLSLKNTRMDAADLAAVQRAANRFQGRFLFFFSLLFSLYFLVYSFYWESMCERGLFVFERQVLDLVGFVSVGSCAMVNHKRMFDLIFLSIYLSIYLSTYLYIYLCTHAFM
jgi:hypothetical protein